MFFNKKKFYCFQAFVFALLSVVLFLPSLSAFQFTKASFFCLLFAGLCFIALLNLIESKKAPYKIALLSITVILSLSLGFLIRKEIWLFSIVIFSIIFFSRAISNTNINVRQFGKEVVVIAGILFLSGLLNEGIKKFEKVHYFEGNEWKSYEEMSQLRSYIQRNHPIDVPIYSAHHRKLLGENLSLLNTDLYFIFYWFSGEEKVWSKEVFEQIRSYILKNHQNDQDYYLSVLKSVSALVKEPYFLSYVILLLFVPIIISGPRKGIIIGAVTAMSFLVVIYAITLVYREPPHRVWNPLVVCFLAVSVLSCRPMIGETIHRQRYYLIPLLALASFYVVGYSYSQSKARKQLCNTTHYGSSESIRVCRRLIILRELANEKENNLFPRSPRACSSYGFNIRA